MAKKEYRKRTYSDTWHWCTNCTQWPKWPDDYETWCGYDRPPVGELCDQCRSKEDNFNCQEKSC